LFGLGVTLRKTLGTPVMVFQIQIKTAGSRYFQNPLAKPTVVANELSRTGRYEGDHWGRGAERGGVQFF